MLSGAYKPTDVHQEVEVMALGFRRDVRAGDKDFRAILLGSNDRMQSEKRAGPRRHHHLR